MKTIHSSLQVKIPEGIGATVNNRVITIKGKRGTLRKSFKHTQLDVKMLGKKRYSSGCKLYIVKSRIGGFQLYLSLPSVSRPLRSGFKSRNGLEAAKTSRRSELSSATSKT